MNVGKEKCTQIFVELPQNQETNLENCR